MVSGGEKLHRALLLYNMTSLQVLQQEAELRRKMDRNPPKYTKGCVMIGVVSFAVLAYGAWMVHSMHQSTSEYSHKLKVGQDPTAEHAAVQNTVGQDTAVVSGVANPNFDDHMNAVLNNVEREQMGWINKERRGETLVLADSMCQHMKPPTATTDVKSYPGIRVEEMSRLVEVYPTIVAGYSSIILLVGTNNLVDRVTLQLNKAYPPQELHSRYIELCKRIQAINKNCTIHSSAVFPRPRDHQLTTPWINEFNGLLKNTFGNKFIQSDQGYADFSQPTQPRFAQGYFHEDGLHLTEAGKNVLSDRYRQVLLGSAAPATAG